MLHSFKTVLVFALMMDLLTLVAWGSTPLQRRLQLEKISTINGNRHTPLINPINKKSVQENAMPYDASHLERILMHPSFFPIPTWNSMTHIMTVFDFIKRHKILEFSSCNVKQKQIKQIHWINDGSCAQRAAAVQIALVKAKLARIPGPKSIDLVDIENDSLPNLPANVFIIKANSGLPLFYLPPNTETMFHWEYVCCIN